MGGCIHAYTCMCVVYMCILACMHVCVCMCVYVCTYVCMCAFDYGVSSSAISSKLWC